MSASRAYKIRSLIERVDSLLISKVIKCKPVWYKVYKCFPPKYEPKFDRAVPEIRVRPIFYEEDKLRAQIQKQSTYIIFNLRSNVSNSYQKSLMDECQTIVASEKMTVEDAVKAAQTKDQNVQESQDEVISTIPKLTPIH